MAKKLIYHGDNYGGKLKLTDKYMKLSNNQEGMGIYFGNLSIARGYGDDITEAEIDTSRFADSRNPTHRVLSSRAVLKMLKYLAKEDLESMWYLATDYGFDVDMEDTIDVLPNLAHAMKDEEIRNFQITLAQSFGTVPLSKAWKSATRLMGLYHTENNPHDHSELTIYSVIDLEGLKYHRYNPE